MNGLNHNALTCSAVPIPPWERSLQTVEAQPYFSVSQASLVLEGIVFDRNNNLLFVDVATGRVFKLTPERQLSIVLKENTFGASGLAVHKDGRIFIASVGDMQRGSVRAIEPNGTREQMIVATDAGFLVNDLVFDNQGGFYFTDSRGNSADPQGGVFYVSPNVGSIHAIHRTPGDHPNALVFTQGQHLTLFFPVKQVVLRLHRDKSGPTVTLSGMLHFCKAPGFHRRCADITRFSCFNDVMQSLHGLFNRRGVVKAMNLKEIHIIHA
ncbi:lactonase Drp35 [Klebsiella pneumoniae]|nr:lactonase Drp35 [Klebsiella pneumoniae]VAU34783.1 Lactonase drp35 [Klebsiella pneumoniae]